MNRTGLYWLAVQGLASAGGCGRGHAPGAELARVPNTDGARTAQSTGRNFVGRPLFWQFAAKRDQPQLSHGNVTRLVRDHARCGNSLGCWLGRMHLPLLMADSARRCLVHRLPHELLCVRPPYRRLWQGEASPLCRDVHSNLWRLDDEVVWPGHRKGDRLESCHRLQVPLRCYLRHWHRLRQGVCCTALLARMQRWHHQTQVHRY